MFQYYKQMVTRVLAGFPELHFVLSGFTPDPWRIIGAKGYS